MSFGSFLVPWMEPFGQFLDLPGKLHDVFRSFLLGHYRFQDE